MDLFVESYFFRMCLLDLDFFGKGNLDLSSKLPLAYTDFKEFCRQHKIDCSQPAFVAHKLFFQDEACLNYKAYNGRIITAWLADRLANAARLFPDNSELVLTSTCLLAAHQLNFKQVWLCSSIFILFQSDS